MSRRIQVTSFFLHVVIFSLLTLINMVIRKALKDHQYYIIRILSFTDSLFSCNVIVFSILMLADMSSENLRIVVGLLGYILYCTSMLVTSLLTIDRLIAVKYCLYYRTYVTKRRINMATFLTFALSACPLLCFFVWDKSKELPSFIWWTTRGVIVYVTVIRLVVCVCIIVTGKLTLKIRKDNEERLKINSQLRHGVKEENLKALQKLKRSVKDIIHLNFWTCIFIIPISTVSILILFDIDLGWSNHELGLANVFSFSLQSLSNPIVYATCFSKIRKHLIIKIIKRKRISSNSSSS